MTAHRFRASTVNALLVATALLLASFATARSGEITGKPTPSADDSSAPKIRVILPAPWEPAAAQAGAVVASPNQRSASR